MFWLLPLLGLQLETYLDRWEPISTRAWKKEEEEKKQSISHTFIESYLCPVNNTLQMC